MHISTFDEKNDHRLFNISIANKLTKGFIRNNHDVVNFSYRDFSSKFMIKSSRVLNNKIYNITQNYRPDLILFGHNNILNEETIKRELENLEKMNIFAKTEENKTKIWAKYVFISSFFFLSYIDINRSL